MSTTTRQDREPRSAERDAVRSAERALARVLEEKGLRRSRQRDVVVRTFFGMGGHVAVDALLEQVRRADPRVGVATVYRTMKLLAEHGLAVPRDFGDGRARYEPATHRHAHSHDHLICTGCGTIVEFESHRIEALQHRVARRHGFEVERRRVELYGRCARCRGVEGNEETAA
ncbi:MAG: transcriptional repressor [Deltaproteobacteria bacterium]|nr:transcriptional repressor [Deltaproteobacteria bacterium]